MHLVIKAFCVGMALLLAGCISTTQPSYFKLEAKAGSSSPGDYGSIGLRPVSIPEYLRRSSMVRSEGDNRLDLNTGDRWAEPLEDGIRRIVTLNVAALLPTDHVQRYPWSTRTQPDTIIALEVLEMTSGVKEARLVVDVDITRSTSSSHLLRFSAKLPEAATGAQIASAHSELLYQLSETIATKIRSGELDD